MDYEIGCAQTVATQTTAIILLRYGLNARNFYPFRMNRSDHYPRTVVYTPCYLFYSFCINKSIFEESGSIARIEVCAWNNGITITALLLGQGDMGLLVASSALAANLNVVLFLFNERRDRLQVIRSVTEGALVSTLQKEHKGRGRSESGLPVHRTTPLAVAEVFRREAPPSAFPFASPLLSLECFCDCVGGGTCDGWYR